MRGFIFIVLLSLVINSGAICAQPRHVRVFATAIGNDSVGAFMGGSSLGSGLFQSDDTGRTWKHLGWSNIKAYSMDMVSSSHGSLLYLATGLGVLRSVDAGVDWQLITDGRFAEVLDIAVDQRDPATIYLATAHGPWRSKDAGVTWQQLLSGLTVPYCSAVVVDSVNPNHVLLAAEDGLFELSEDSSWRPVDVGRVEHEEIQLGRTTKVRALAQISHLDWIATTEGEGVLVSHNGASNFTQLFPDSGFGWSVSESERWIICGGRRGVLRIDLGDKDFLDRKSDEHERDVHACIQVGDVQLLGTLGEGVYRSGIAVPSLPKRQIWRLKSFRVGE